MINAAIANCVFSVCMRCLSPVIVFIRMSRKHRFVYRILALILGKMFRLA